MRPRYPDAYPRKNGSSETVAPGNRRSERKFYGGQPCPEHNEKPPAIVSSVPAKQAPRLRLGAPAAIARKVDDRKRRYSQESRARSRALREYRRARIDKKKRPNRQLGLCSHSPPARRRPGNRHQKPVRSRA